MSRSLVLAVLAGLALAGCGGGSTTVVVSSPPRTVTVGAGQTGTQPPPRTPPSVPFRQPRPDEGVFDVDGTVTDVQVHRAPGPAGGGASGYTSFVIRAEAGPPLRAGAPGDLRLNTSVKQSLLDPACAGRVRARFTVAPARYTGNFDYALVRVRVLRDACRP